MNTNNKGMASTAAGDGNIHKLRSLRTLMANSAVTKYARSSLTTSCEQKSQSVHKQQHSHMFPRHVEVVIYLSVHGECDARDVQMAPVQRCM
jgi:hypothetical protein